MNTFSAIMADLRSKTDFHVLVIGAGEFCSLTTSKAYHELTGDE